MFKETIAKFLKLDSLMENVTGYVETRIEILQYDLKEDLARVLSKVSVLLTLVLIVTLFLMFFSMALAFQISKSLGMFAGFGIVSAVYIAIGLIIYSQREVIAKRIETEIKQVIKQKKK